MTSMTSCIVGKKIRAMGPGPLELFPFVVLAIKFCIFLNFVSKISQELLYLQTWNFVHMTSMTSYIVGKKIRAMGSGPLELFPFVVLAIKFCIFIAPACSRVRYRRPIFCPSVCPSVSPSVRLSTFMLTFDIYVKVSILINYKTKQPSNLAWNISLTSWLCNIGVRFSICLSIRPSVCQHLCRRSTFMSKLVF